MLKRVAGRLFDARRVYAEREINTQLASCYDDFATLRRYLVSAGLLVRSADGAEYRIKF